MGAVCAVAAGPGPGASPARIASLARAPLRLAKGAGDHEGRPYGFRVLALDGRDGFRWNGGVTRLRRLGSV